MRVIGVAVWSKKLCVGALSPPFVFKGMDKSMLMIQTTKWMGEPGFLVSSPSMIGHEQEWRSSSAFLIPGGRIDLSDLRRVRNSNEDSLNEEEKKGRRDYSSERRLLAFKCD